MESESTRTSLSLMTFEEFHSLFWHFMPFHFSLFYCLMKSPLTWEHKNCCTKGLYRKCDGHQIVELNSFFYCSSLPTPLACKNACHTFRQTFIVSKFHYHILRVVLLGSRWLAFHVLWTVRVVLWKVERNFYGC